MSSFPILDLVIGMIFVFFLLSIISSSAVEIVLTVQKIRAKMLEAWLVEIFKEPFAKEIMNHGSVTALSGKNQSPSYIDAKNFTNAVIEKITYDPGNPTSIASNLDSIIASLQQTNLLDDELKRSFLIYAAEAKETYRSVSNKTVSEIGLFKGKIESWYDSSMDRVAGKLKTTHSRKLTFWLGALIIIALNADSVAIAKYLYSNPEARIALASQASGAIEDTALQNKVNALTASLASSSDPSVKASATAIKAAINNSITEIKATKRALQESVPLGWNSHVFDDAEGKPNGFMIVQKIIGLLASILAVMMGAPFWFDLLNKVSNLRGAGKKPAQSDGTDNVTQPLPAPITVNVSSKPVDEAVG